MNYSIYYNKVYIMTSPEKPYKRFKVKHKMRINGLKLLKIAQSKGFIIPIQYTKERVEGGLEEGKRYSLDISEAEE